MPAERDKKTLAKVKNPKIEPENEKVREKVALIFDKSKKSQLIDIINRRRQKSALNLYSDSQHPLKHSQDQDFEVFRIFKKSPKYPSYQSKYHRN